MLYVLLVGGYKIHNTLKAYLVSTGYLICISWLKIHTLEAGNHNTSIWHQNVSLGLQHF